MVDEHDELIEVRMEDDAPVQFVWRGRLYRVHRVLNQWVESAPWWRSQSTVGIPAEPSARDVWRVEVSAGGASPVEVVDLSFDRVRRTWSATTEID